MQITLTLPDNLVSRLISQAKAINLTLNEFLLKTLQNSALTPAKSQTSGVENNFESELSDSATVSATSSIHFEEDSLADVVKRIKARPPNPANIHRATKTVDELVKDLDENPSEISEFSPVEWEQMWAEFEYDMKLLARQKNRRTLTSVRLWNYHKKIG